MAKKGKLEPLSPKPKPLDLGTPMARAFLDHYDRERQKARRLASSEEE